MDIIILVGSVIALLGLMLMVVNSKWDKKRAGYYKTKNKSISRVSIILIIMGLAIVIFRAYLNGQLG